MTILSMYFSRDVRALPLGLRVVHIVMYASNACTYLVCLSGNVPIANAKHTCVRDRSQLSTFMKAYTAYARGEGVWDHRTLFSRKSTFICNH